MGVPRLSRAALIFGALAVASCGNVTSSPSSDQRDAAATGAGGAQAGSGGTTGTTGAGGATGTGGLALGTGGSILGSDCRRNDECAAAGAQCLAPGESPGCGVCRQPTVPCNSDADCTARQPGAICELAPCSCSDQKSCVPGCVDGSTCAAGQFCAADHRCANNVCQANDRSCLPNFTCGADGRCTRKGCMTDADCDGACVKGMCQTRPGTCTPAAA